MDEQLKELVAHELYMVRADRDAWDEEEKSTRDWWRRMAVAVEKAIDQGGYVVITKGEHETLSAKKSPPKQRRRKREPKSSPKLDSGATTEDWKDK
jgi:hypothetical protein